MSYKTSGANNNFDNINRSMKKGIVINIIAVCLFLVCLPFFWYSAGVLGLIIFFVILAPLVDMTIHSMFVLKRSCLHRESRHEGS